MRRCTTDDLLLIMTEPEPATSLWRGINRLEFHENAILLELKDKSQGAMTTSKKNEKPNQYSERLLDDIALIASGGGGPDNVTAVCLEKAVGQPPGFVIRIARNEGLEEGTRQQLQRIVEMAKGMWNSDVLYASAKATLPSTRDVSSSTCGAQYRRLSPTTRNCPAVRWSGGKAYYSIDG